MQPFGWCFLEPIEFTYPFVILMETPGPLKNLLGRSIVCKFGARHSPGERFIQPFHLVLQPRDSPAGDGRKNLNLPSDVTRTAMYCVKASAVGPKLLGPPFSNLHACEFSKTFCHYSEEKLHGLFHRLVLPAFVE